MTEHSHGRDQLLSGKVALITGAGRGIGAATATTFAVHGAKVAVNYLKNKDAADEVVRTITAAQGEAFAVQADVREHDEVARIVATITARWGSPDILVLNADAGHFRPTPITATTFEQYEQRLRDEMAAAIMPTKIIAPQMVAQRSGCILAISSALCRAPIADFSLLAVSKGALEAFIRALAVELGPHGVRANVIEASMIDDENGSVVPYEQRVWVTRSIPLRRIGRPEDVANAATLVASGLAAFIQGATIPVNGGQVLF